MSPTGRTNPRVLFLIPARGGSKGLPGKNLACVGGIPLVGRAARLGRSAMNALGAGGRVVCSTDDAQIADAARAWGAEVPFLRPPEFASDGARSIDVVYHALDALQTDFDAVVLLQPTSPLTEDRDVLEAIALHQRSGLPVVSVCPAEHPAEWLYTIDEEGHLSRLLSSVGLPDQRQQARRTFRANGAVYVSTSAALRRHDSFFGPQTHAFVMPVHRSMDVDNAFDLNAARAALANRPVPPVFFASRSIGANQRCFVIAAADVNPTGDVVLARSLVDATLAAGADAVTFYAPALDENSHRELLEYGNAKGILFLPTPSDETSADLFDAVGVAAFRVSSRDITDQRFVRHVARKHKPIILSTEMATLSEVCDAVDVIWDAGNRSLVLLHGVSHTPADPPGANLRAIATLREACGVPVGFSDHTVGEAIPFAAVALGACVIEKQFTLDRAGLGADHQQSTEPEAFRQMVHGIRAIESGLGTGSKGQ